MEKDSQLKYYKDLKDDQTRLSLLGYYFDDLGKLKSLTSKAAKFKFTNQEEYNELGRAICEFVQTVLEKIYHMKKHNGITENDYIYISNSFFESAKPCLILIQGSGMVRPGYAYNAGFGPENAVLTTALISAQ
jgi:hypothetical protein